MGHVRNDESTARAGGPHGAAVLLGEPNQETGLTELSNTNASSPTAALQCDDVGGDGSCPATGSGCQTLGAPIVGAAGPDSGGYWLVGADGGVFGFGDAHFHGSCPIAGSGCTGLTSVVGIASPDAGGYWVATNDGSVYTFGDAKFYGSCPVAGSGCQTLVRPIVAITG